jgi:hypothetical protein
MLDVSAFVIGWCLGIRACRAHVGNQRTSVAGSEIGIKGLRESRQSDDARKGRKDQNLLHCGLHLEVLEPAFASFSPSIAFCEFAFLGDRLSTNTMNRYSFRNIRLIANACGN